MEWDTIWDRTQSGMGNNLEWDTIWNNTQSGMGHNLKWDTIWNGTQSGMGHNLDTTRSNLIQPPSDDKDKPIQF